MNIKTVTLARMFNACGRFAVGDVGLLAAFNAGQALALRAIHGDGCIEGPGYFEVARCYLEARRLLVQSIRQKRFYLLHQASIVRR